MSKTYIADILQRTAVPRSEKLRGLVVPAPASSRQHGSAAAASGAADSVFWKYFGLDENGGLYVKKNEAGEARNFWTYGNLSAGGINSDSQDGGGGVSYLRDMLDVYHSGTVLRTNGTPVQSGDTLAYDATYSRWHAKAGLVAGQDYLTPSAIASGYAAKSLEGVVASILAKIPAEAASSNQLADKAFVNSSIASSTGTFQGTYTSTAQLPTTGINANDYAFVTTTDGNSNTVYNRYKYNGSQWTFEYSLNNSSFTSAQWSAINSGITAEKVTGYDSLVSNVQSDWNANTGLSAILNKPASLKNPYPLSYNRKSYDGSVSGMEITGNDITGILGYTPYDAANPNGYTSNVGTITGIRMNGSVIGTSGVVDLGTVVAPANAGTSGQYLVSQGGNTAPVWVTPGSIASGNTALVTGGAVYTALQDYLLESDFRLDILCKNVIGASTDLNGVFDKTRDDLRGKLSYYAYVGRTTSNNAGINGFPTISNANALLTIGTYSDSTSQYLYQMGFSANGSIYFRNGYAEKSGGTWGSAFGNGDWKRLLWEDHNGDATTTRDLITGRHLTLARGNRLRLDADGDAYFVRGSGTDYGLYISAGHEANGTTQAMVYFEARAFLPGAGSGDLGADWLMWNNLHAKRWYPKANDYTVYIEWDSTNNAFKIVGNVYATGQVAAGGIISNS